jgi:hypothetical protein
MTTLARIRRAGAITACAIALALGSAAAIAAVAAPGGAAVAHNHAPLAADGTAIGWS